ncbi:DUF1080 domain-containing protein [Sphingobium sp. HBC34]|uniref:DUF1080 domain-containing protein n=1 Tax=Sphingobium cyanobacteriorum TaxID=3063954 RepID=A0ABT8ZQB1_9SPHN|nr:DUF1080 domain-containing protein [Sphingobium sp. HBC34]MDO7836628.1 DUF1080 domain-containing protein [Sphingobium sp. HBC34]
MTIRNVLTACTLLLATANTAMAAGGPPDGSTPEQQRIVAGDPPLQQGRLALVDLPRPTKAPVSLFNGRDLKGWDSWLGYTDAISTFTGPTGEPIGLNKDMTGVFRVVQEDGRPAIHVSGKILGALLSKRSYSNYHLRLQFKWGANSWYPFPRNNGLLYHSHGKYGAALGSWMPAMEFEIMPRSIGMLLAVSDYNAPQPYDSVDWRVNADVEVAQDKSIPYPYRRYMPGGRLQPLAFPAFNVDANVDAEKPMGEWNILDLYTFGDRSIHVVNGVPVLEARNLMTKNEAGKPVPLTSGRIQLQSEGSEAYFRDITIEPIDHLPKIERR